MEKACPVVVRLRRGLEILAFRHPEAGLQIVKGTIEPNETPEQAALRELREEAGIESARVIERFGVLEIGADTWHFVRVQTDDLPERWAALRRWRWVRLFVLLASAGTTARRGVARQLQARPALHRRGRRLTADFSQ